MGCMKINYKIKFNYLHFKKQTGFDEGAIQR